MGHRFISLAGADDSECLERKQGVSDVHGERDQVQPQLRHLYYDEPGIRRPHGTARQLEGATAYVINTSKYEPTVRNTYLHQQLYFVGAHARNWKTTCSRALRHVVPKARSDLTRKLATQMLHNVTCWKCLSCRSCHYPACFSARQEVTVSDYFYLSAQ